ncbi:MAG: hypothetical protein ACR2NU_17180 [Aeoliella sp.]
MKHDLANSPIDPVEISCAAGDVIANDVLDQLEALDDTIFAALDGDADALDRARSLLVSAHRDLHGHLFEESRRQYARRAKSVWRTYLDNPGESLTSAFAALEVLELVSDD